MKFICISAALLATASLSAQSTTTPASTEPYLQPSAVDQEDIPAEAFANAVAVTFFWDNDGAFTKPVGSTDRWYTSGSGGAVQWRGPGTTEMLSWMPSIGGEFDVNKPGVSYAAGIALALNIYTAKEIADPNIRPDDRPYAGWTYGGFIAQRANRAVPTPTYEHWELDAGAMGPVSQAGEVQKWVHRVFGEQYPMGWEYQVRDEFGADFKYQRRWRINLGEESPLTGASMQVIPDAGFTLGTIHTNASGGATLRYGWNLPDDFGPGNMRYAEDFTRTIEQDPSGTSAYFFLRPGVRAVAHDATLGDSLFRDSNPVAVDPTPLGADCSAGMALIFFGRYRLTYAQTFMSPEFEGQSQWQSFASLTVSAAYAW